MGFQKAKKKFQKAKKKFRKAKKKFLKLKRKLYKANESEESEISEQSDFGELVICPYNRYATEYKELEELGKGGYGKVFKCIYNLDGMMYAVKKVPFCSGEQHRVLREVQALSQFQHPHIVRYYQAWIEDGVPTTKESSESDPEESIRSVEPSKTLYILMEYCAGTLVTKIKEEIQREDFFCKFRALFEGLCYIHEKGIIHRDVSRSNIFFDSHGTLKLGDFGIAITFEAGSDTTIGTGLVGNLLYLAPEIDAKSPTNSISPLVDVYSSGIVLFEMLYKFRSDVERATVLMNLRKSVFPEDWTTVMSGTKVTPSLTALIALRRSVHPLLTRILNKDPAARPSASAVLKDPLLHQGDYGLIQEVETEMEAGFE